MSNSRQNKRRSARKLSAAQSETCGVDIYTGAGSPGGGSDLRIEGINVGGSSPEDKNQAFKRSRYFATRNLFVQVVLALRLSVYNAGAELVAIEKSDRKKLETWKKDRVKNARAQQEIARYKREAWNEWFITANVINLWREDSSWPVVLNPEEIDYRDKFGREVLIITHSFTDKEIDALKISAEAKARLKKSKKIEITHDDELFSFEVLKREKLGNGLAWPALMPVLLACGQFESQEVRHNVLAEATRLVLEQWKVGHETRYGMAAGGPQNFFKKKHFDDIKKNLGGKKGHLRYVANFDQTVEWVGPKPEHYDSKHFSGALERLIWWALPFGHMIVARAFNPLLMDVLRPMVMNDRDEMRRMFEFVINDVWTLPCPVTVKWDDTCLRDARTFTTLVQNGLNTGPISQQTYREAAGVDNEREMERKESEAGLDKKITQPIYDGNHGAPGKNGKKPGGKDES